MLTQRRPGVFIFGWLGAKPYHLARVASFYDGLGVDCETFIQSHLSLLNIREQTTEMLKLYQKSLNRPVLMHVFSLNGGAVLFKTFADKNLAIKPEINLKALILDSTPGHVNTALYHRAFSQAIFPRSQTNAKIAQSVLKPLFHTFLFFARSHTKAATAYSEQFFAHPFRVPTLMLGSQQDELIPNRDMVEYAEKAARAGVDVRTRFWPDSGHIRLYREHRPEYIDLVREFTKQHLLK